MPTEGTPPLSQPAPTIPQASPQKNKNPNPFGNFKPGKQIADTTKLRQAAKDMSDNKVENISSVSKPNSIKETIPPTISPITNIFSSKPPSIDKSTGDFSAFKNSIKQGLESFVKIPIPNFGANLLTPTGISREAIISVVNGKANIHLSESDYERMSKNEFNILNLLPPEIRDSLTEEDSITVNIYSDDEFIQVLSYVENWLTNNKDSENTNEKEPTVDEKNGTPREVIQTLKNKSDDSQIDETKKNEEKKREKQAFIKEDISTKEIEKDAEASRKNKRKRAEEFQDWKQNDSESKKAKRFEIQQEAIKQQIKDQ